ncbi:hypothetical protein S101446_03094 [Komagataeibacter europaeus]|nr:hypothetical protein S101446_03094 [Komagataeibacter europaeus]
MAQGQLASWDQRWTGGPLCSHADTRCRWSSPAYRWSDGPAYMPGDEAWLIGGHRSTGERKYYLSNLSADTSLRLLAAAIKVRWVCERAHRQIKEELGLDHFEGRSWTGPHRHALMSMMAYAFLQSRRLKAVGRKKKRHRATSTARSASNTTGHS